MNMFTPCRVKVCVVACVVGAAVSLLTPAHASAQAAPPRALTVTVTDKKGGLVTGLQREAFTVLDGGRPSEIVSFAAGDMPATVGVLLDASGSVAIDRAGLVSGAMRRFFKGCHPSNEFFFIAFNLGAQLIQGMTDEPEKVLAALDKYAAVEPRGRTVFYDAVYLGLNHAARGRHAKRALVLVTDGRDNGSFYKLKDLRRQLKESDVIVYAVGIVSPGAESALDYEARSILEELASTSGGRVFYPETEKDLNAAFEDLAKELRNQYVIGFAPAAEAKKDGWHEVRVRLGEVRAGGKKVKAVARARAGFYDVPPPRRD
jgi:Ca-activated chloride channel family protein